jgi:hypothetical protein
MTHHDSEVQHDDTQYIANCTELLSSDITEY